ncbi:MAG TPA: phosphatase PAP2 family protein [Thermoanaerobaculia bacterium]|nr:phosphatase PAP2 family protein [Thermoanaerobaculia bacterium]
MTGAHRLCLLFPLVGLFGARALADEAGPECPVAAVNDVAAVAEFAGLVTIPAFGTDDSCASDDALETPPAAAPRDTPTPAKTADTFKVPSEPQLLLQDAIHVATGPLHWKKRDWYFLGGTIVGLSVLSLADDRVTKALTTGGKNTFFDDVLDVFEPIGAGPGLGGAATVWIYGAVFHDRKARTLGFDLLTADVLASAITAILKGIVGRGRPNANEGSFSFQPLRNASFPSGHTTQAFAFATVISATYGKTWITVASFTAATLVGVARVRHSAHFATDIAAGALIGTSTALSVVRFNRRQRTNPENTPERVILSMAPSVNGRGAALVVGIRLGRD